MKKLMIAAAAAAMIGVAEAGYRQARYHFVANLQTTTGSQSGTVATTPITWDLGQDNANWKVANYYYQDGFTNRSATTTVTTPFVNTNDYPVYQWVGAVTNIFKNLAWQTKPVDEYGTIVPVLNIVSADGSVTDAEKNFLNYLAGKYNKGAICHTLSAMTYSSGCYRVAGANFLEEDLVLQNTCCAVGSTTKGFYVENPNFKFVPTATNAISWDNIDTGAVDSTLAGVDVFNRFGAFKSEDANLLEIFAYVSGINTRAGYHGVPFYGYLAGQGYWQWDGIGVTVAPLFTAESRIPAQISGNIVGYTEASLCDVCCARPTETLAFECLNATATTTPCTAAYGTFYLNFIEAR